MTKGVVVDVLRIGQILNTLRIHNIICIEYNIIYSQSLLMCSLLHTRKKEIKDDPSLGPEQLEL